MWNQLRTDEYEGMLAETITMPGYNGDRIHAYLSRPLGKGPYPGIILIPHIPGWGRALPRDRPPVHPARICGCSAPTFIVGSDTELPRRLRKKPAMRAAFPMTA